MLSMPLWPFCCSVAGVMSECDDGREVDVAPWSVASGYLLHLLCLSVFCLHLGKLLVADTLCENIPHTGFQLEV